MTLTFDAGFMSAIVAPAAVTEPPNPDSARAQRAFGAITPEISPDGQTIAFSYQGAIWRMPRAGGAMRRLTSGPGFDHLPSWSPDGKRLVYLDMTTGEVRLIEGDDGRPIRTLPGVLANGKVYFQQDGRHLLVGLRTAALRSVTLRVVDSETGRILPLNLPAKPVPCYAPSADGTQFALAEDHDVAAEQTGNFGPQTDLWVISAQGGKPRLLFEHPARIIQLWWASDRIFFTSDFGGAHYDLWSVAADGIDQPQKLTFGQADEQYPSVSADGRWLVYSDNREGTTALMVRDLLTGRESPSLPMRLDFGATTGVLRLSIVEKGTQLPLVARVSIRQEDGKCFAPLGSLYRIARNGEHHFYCRHDADVPLPAGRYVVRGVRGPEYREFRQEIEVPPGGTRDMPIEMERWTNQPTRSFWSGDSHVHANYGYGEWYCTPEILRLILEGEDLHVGNLVVANSHGDGVFDREFFRGAPDPASGPATVLYWNEEFRSTLWGHMTLLNLKHLVEPIFTGFPGTTNPWDFPTTAEISDQVHLQNGVVLYTHPGSMADAFFNAFAAKGLPVDVALGKIDALDIDRADTLTLWYALLNCGFHLGASSGTDVFLNRLYGASPGHVRAYASIDGPVSHEGWANSLRNGRTFVTNGPMLELTVADATLGDTVRLSAAGMVPVRARATWQFPLERAELVHNGEVIASAKLSEDRLAAILDQEVRIARSGWLSFRAYGAERGARAHTGAVYTEVAGRRTGSRKDATAFLHWIDLLEARIKERRRVPSPEMQARIQANLDGARVIYREIAARGD